MKDSNLTETLNRNVEVLSATDLPEYGSIPQHNTLLPSVPKLKRLVELLRVVFFPGYFGEVIIFPESLRCHIGVILEEIYWLLLEQIKNGLSFNEQDLDDTELMTKAEKKALAFIDQLPELKRVVSTDVKETFDGDPAANSFAEVIFSYPTIRAVFNYRIAHALLQLDIPVLPRIISELAHSETGIEIHPGAKIGEYFSINHGTGVVIGETTIIGNHVRLYQGVTLGARHITQDVSKSSRNELRHPILEDNVVIYANSTVLGCVTIGAHSVIGGNVWLTYNVPPHSSIQQQRAVSEDFYGGLGI